MSVIAFIGLGNMGSGMALNLAKADHDVLAVDLSAEAVDKVVAGGAKNGGTTKEAVSNADVVVTMLPAGKHVRAVYSEVFASAKPGALFLDCSTIDVDTARAVIADATAKGFQMIDAPVSGGTAAADAGTLTFMCGGEKAAFQNAEPYLQVMGKAVIHAGDAGAGQAAKICNNMLLGITMIGTCEAFALAEKLGLEAQTFFDISSKASGQSWSMTSYCPVAGPVPSSPANRDYAPGFAVPMMLKDLKLAVGAAASANAATPMGALAEALYQAFSLQGDNNNKDFSGIINFLK